jgi:alpha-L-fucosidase
VPKLEEKEFRAEYDITKLVDAPPAGYARVEAFVTAGDGALYAIVPRRVAGEIVLDDVEASSAVRVTLLETGQPVEAAMIGRQLRIRVPDSLAATLPARQAYVFKLAGGR